MNQNPIRTYAVKTFARKGQIERVALDEFDWQIGRKRSFARLSDHCRANVEADDFSFRANQRADLARIVTRSATQV